MDKNTKKENQEHNNQLIQRFLEEAGELEYPEFFFTMMESFVHYDAASANFSEDYKIQVIQRSHSLFKLATGLKPVE